MAIRLRIPFAPQKIGIPPPVVLAALYAVLIFSGAALLKLPSAATVPISWSDAIFTATSAVTVTGLTVRDTGSDFTLLGQVIIAALIQFGGLGIMTFAVLAMSMLGLPIGWQHRVYLREDLNQTSIPDLFHLVWVILRVVITCEIIGAAALCLVFVPEFGYASGIWMALFHSISAFNNAGFGLLPDSLSRWVSSPIVNITIPALFIIGGIGFSVLHDVWKIRSWKKLSLHSKIMISGTFVLIAFPTIGFFALEWSNPKTLGALDSISVRIMVSWFQSVTTRTAGFNTVDIGSVRDSTALMMITLMLIGGGSTSTAGGIKVSSFFVLILATIAFYRRNSALNLFGRSLGREEVMKVVALTTVSMLLVFIGVFTISISHDGSFLNIAFEVASAFGTVGLSRGLTGSLDELGRWVIVVTMFLGRVGPLTLGFLLATRGPARIRYPSGRVFLG